MAAPRKNAQPINTNSGGSTPMTEDEKARVAAAEQQPEQTPNPAPTDGEANTGDDQSDGTDYAALAAEAAHDALAADPGTEDVTLGKDVGGHRAGDTITVTHGSADYLREQGYLEDHDED
ncbi:hypothetical protein ACIPJ2_16120 [Curtobacterium sp. NPDC090217]|uniref:hypothetical protein n=1 Tax=Curtobacterium sp. NPDC090217 TaxID=3363970 RepID=UPI00381AFC1A